jgi:glycosyltransferase involved in cell wall biosynthesis
VGDQYTLRSYDEFQLPPVQLIPNTGYPALFNEDQSGRSPTSFLFLGSVGQVHKGLDILLEVFAKRPSLQLFVCGHFAQESDFCRAYRRELFTTPNIVPLGFLDIRSDRFREVASRCSFVVMPSCAEGMSGSVLTGMSAGLVPIVSRECGLSGRGIHHFADCSVEGVADAVEQLSTRAPSWIAEAGRAAMQLVRDQYSPAHYSAALIEAMTRLLAGDS